MLYVEWFRLRRAIPLLITYIGITVLIVLVFVLSRLNIDKGIIIASVISAVAAMSAIVGAIATYISSLEMRRRIEALNYDVRSSTARFAPIDPVFSEPLRALIDSLQSDAFKEDMVRRLAA